MTVQALVAITNGVASTATNTIKPKAKDKEEAKVFENSVADQELVEISRETGEVGPTRKNAEKLAERQEASNPFVKRGSHNGANIYNNLDNIDWTTGQFLNLTLGQ